MTLRRVRLRPDSGAAALAAAFATIREENEVPAEFPPDVLAEAQEAARATTPPERDETGVEFVTIDPPGSKDLDQALAIDADGSGYRVRYAIADVPAFVAPGGAVDLEARRRVQTLYLPDGRSPLHPPVLSEGAASLLPDSERSAYVWDLRLDADAVVVETQVYRARVRSRAQLDYASVQADLDAGRAPRVIELLAQVGPRRMELELARGGASLPMPEQEVQVEGSGPDAVYRLRYRPPAPVEDYNAQISLMTGMAAADLMLDAASASCARCPRRRRRPCGGSGESSPPTDSPGRRSRVTGPSCGDSIAPIPCTSRSSTRRRACFAEPGTRRSTERAPSRCSMRRSRMRTPTSRRRCAGSSTASAWRCAPR